MKYPKQNQERSISKTEEAEIFSKKLLGDCPTRRILNIIHLDGHVSGKCRDGSSPPSHTTRIIKLLKSLDTRIEALSLKDEIEIS